MLLLQRAAKSGLYQALLQTQPENPTQVKIYESEIERPTVRYARDLGLIAIKLYPWHQQGIPDRLFIGPGPRFEFVEFKRAGEKPKKGQVKWIERLKQFNIYVNVIDNLNEAKALIRSMATQISTTTN